MILVGETDPRAREVPFHLPLAADPLSPLVGHVFVAGEVRVRLPGAAYVDADPTAVVEKGYGDYALVLTLAQAANRGDVYLEANVPGAQPWTSEETICGVAGPGTIAVGETNPAAREVWFHLADPVNPLTPVTGHVFVVGEVRICLPGGPYADADNTAIVEKGYGDYALVLAAGQVTARGKAYIRAAAASSQTWTGLVDIVAGIDATPPSIVVVSPTPGVAAGAPGGFSADPVVARSTQIVIEVTDIAPGLQYFVVTARLYTDPTASPIEEVVYRRGAYRGPYVAGSTTDIITAGVRLHVLRTGGWPTGTAPKIVFSVDALDGAGNLAA